MAKKKLKPKSSNPGANPPPSTLTNALQTDALDTARNTSTPPVFMKLCRLCESKDGPFLNIFGAERGIVKKIDVLLPFSVSEYDDLPHKICFRCSAKLEELHEFVEKSIVTQENLYKTIGKKGFIIKTKARKLWEDKLTKSNMSNEDVCNAVIEKAMAGINVLPNHPDEGIDAGSSTTKKKLRSENKNESVEKTKEILSNSINKPIEIPPTPIEPKIEENVVKPIRSTRASIVETKIEPLEDKDLVRTETNNTKKSKNKIKKMERKEKEIKQKNKAIEEVKEVNQLLKIDFNDESDSICKSNENNSKTVENPPEKLKDEPEKPPFDIMTHVCTIKVNGVGILFQCNLCNRNFLNKDGVMSHGCAKTGVPKLDKFSSSSVAMPTGVRPRNPISNVKYITNNVNHKSQHVINAEQATVKLKPKIGPASKVKKCDDVPIVGMKVIPREPTPPPPPTPPVAPVQTASLPAIEVPPIPGMKNRYRLVPGPNNTFTLIEDSTAVAHTIDVTPTAKEAPKRKLEDNQSKTIKMGPKSKVKKPDINEEIVRVSSDSTPRVAGSAPYPVGLFQAATPDVSVAPPLNNSAPVTFTTPAMKKQSYTVVQTGNPSKLLISAKPQHHNESPKPKSKRKSNQITQPEQPFKLTMEENSTSRDTGFFTFINVDPLLQPSYVLPTDNIIQESQISSSALPVPGGSKQGKDTYDCELCPEKFTREKKLLVHLQAHYNKMDEERLLKDERVTRKRKKS